MRAREIIYYVYSDIYTKKLKKAIKRCFALGEHFNARVLQSKLQRWLTAAKSEEVQRQTTSNFKASMRAHTKGFGRERLTLRDLNRVRKLRYAATHEKYASLQDKERIYGKSSSE